MIINKLKCFLLCIFTFVLYTACEEEKIPELYELAPKMTAYEASVSGNTVTIRIDDLAAYLGPFGNGQYRFCLSQMSDMEFSICIDLRNMPSNSESVYDFCLQGDLLTIGGLEEEKTYYYYTYILKGKSWLRTEIKSFTITR